MVSRVLYREGADMKTMGQFYKAVVQAVLLCGSEIWTLTKMVVKMLDSFHKKCARFIAGEFIHRTKDGEWHLPRSKDVLEKCGLMEISAYLEVRKENVMRYDLFGRFATSPKYHRQT